MTTAEFRKLALALPETTEAAHVGHPDFRVRGRIFATLGYPDTSYGVLMLTPAEQRDATARNPEAFSPVKGAWGRRGNTLVLLRAMSGKALRPWIKKAWEKVAPKSLSKAVGDQS